MDGDADRPMIADENGHFLRGDLIGAITADVLGADCVVTPITSNSGIERSARFARVVRTRIGSPYVIEGMKKAVAKGARTVVAFEANGGVLLGSDAYINGRFIPALPTRDALLPILAVLWAARRSSKQISALAQDFSFGDAVSGRLERISTTKSGSFLSKLLESAEFRTQLLDGVIRVNTVDSKDGIRMVGADGDILH